MRAWVYKNLGFTTNIRILWYEGNYRNDFGSIFPIGDLTEAIPEGFFFIFFPVLFQR